MSRHTLASTRQHDRSRCPLFRGFGASALALALMASGWVVLAGTSSSDFDARAALHGVSFDGLLSSAHAQDAEPSEDPDDPSTLHLKEPLKLPVFLRLLSKRLDMPIVWDPKDKKLSKEIQGSLNLTGPKKDIFSISRALLGFYDLVMVPVGPPEYRVQMVMDARATNTVLRLKPEYQDVTDENVALLENQDARFITTTIKVENLDSLREASAALKRIVTPSNVGNVQEVPQAKAFVVTDFAPNVAAIYRLLRSMDVKPESSELMSRYFPLQHATADEVEAVLTDLFTGADSLQAARQPQNQRNRTASSNSSSADPEPRIISDIRTNQVIVYATKRDLDEIADVIAKLDVEVHITRDRIHVIRLKNLEAIETAEVLSSLIEAASIFGRDGGATGGGANTQGGRPNRINTNPDSIDPRDEEKPAVVADEKSNSLIIAGTKRQFDEIKRVLDEIDVQKDQVLIEAALIELTLEDAYRVAFELGLADDNGAVNDDAASAFGFTSYGQTVFADKDGDTFFTDRIPPFIDSDANAAPRGLVGGIFAFGQVPLIFNLLSRIDRSRILQLPSIVTADNEEAFIQVQDEQAFSESSSTGNAVTGGLGGFEAAGTTLRISPHIADQNYLLLNINLEVSAFAGEPRQLADGSQIPADKIRRTLQTVVTVPDRHTVVLGGLMGRTQTSTDEKVPYASEIPILGELFKSTTRRDRETNLFLFVTPTIMHGAQSFDILDIESCRRKQKSDELIGFTDIYNAKFVGCDQQDAASGVYNGGRAGGTYGVRKPGCAPRGRGLSGANALPESTLIESDGVAAPHYLPPSDAMPSLQPGDVLPDSVEVLPDGTFIQGNGMLPAGGEGLPAPVVNSGSVSDRLESIGMLEATRFHGMSPSRLDAETAARRGARDLARSRRFSGRRGGATGLARNSRGSAGSTASARRAALRGSALRVGSVRGRATPGASVSGSASGALPAPRVGSRRFDRPSYGAPGAGVPRGYWRTGGT